MKTIRGLHDALLLLLVVVVIGVVGCGENTDQPLVETTSAVPFSPQATLSQTNVQKALQMPQNGTMQKPGGTMMGMGGMMHQDGNMPMEDDQMEPDGMEQMPDKDSKGMGKMMEGMMGDDHHQAMFNAMKTMHAEHHQQPAAQPQKPAEPPPAQPGQQVPDEHNQHHP